MSMPSDVTADVSDAIENEARIVRPETSRITNEQVGLIAAGVVAFLGIAYIGPMITRLTRGPSRTELARRRLYEARVRAAATGGEVRRRVKRLGGGSTWR